MCGQAAPDTLTPPDDAEAVGEMLPDRYAGSALRGGEIPGPDKSGLRAGRREGLGMAKRDGLKMILG